MILLRCLFLAILVRVGSYGYSLTGCYSTKPQEEDSMTLSYQADNHLTVSECSRKCQMSGRAYSGILKASACYCGDEFGLTPPMTDCNYTCSDLMVCGGLSSYTTYYVPDNPSKDWKYEFFPDSKTFYDSRKKCIKMGGDIVGRTVKNEADKISSAVTNFSTTVSVIWLGLRKRDQEYEWVDEKDPNQGDTYAKEKYMFANQWTADDSHLKCVSFDVKSKKFISRNCTDALLPFVCYLPSVNSDSSGVTTSQSPSKPEDSTDPEEKSRNLALLIVLPIFCICYGGACILYCTNQIIKHCCAKGYKHSKLRPSSSKKSSVHPESINPTQTRIVPPLVPYPEKTPYAATPAMDEKKAKLLENASREALERRMKEGEDGKASRIFSGQKKAQQETEDQPERPVQTSNLLPPPASSSADNNQPPDEDQEPAQSMAGKSINEILRLKMAQQANKKRQKKILAA